MNTCPHGASIGDTTSTCAGTAACGAGYAVAAPAASTRRPLGRGTTATTCAQVEPSPRALRTPSPSRALAQPHSALTQQATIPITAQAPRLVTAHHNHPPTHVVGGQDDLCPSSRHLLIAAVSCGGHAYDSHLGARGRLGRQDEAHNQAVQTQRLGEDEDEHHADVQLRLLGGGAHAR